MSVTKKEESNSSNSTASTATLWRCCAPRTGPVGRRGPSLIYLKGKLALAFLFSFFFFFNHLFFRRPPCTLPGPAAQVNEARATIMLIPLKLNKDRLRFPKEYQPLLIRIGLF
jgi:hypothetical protein